jgi:hypothetical protein
MNHEGHKGHEVWQSTPEARFTYLGNNDGFAVASDFVSPVVRQSFYPAC